MLNSSMFLGEHNNDTWSPLNHNEWTITFKKMKISSALNRAESSLPPTSSTYQRVRQPAWQAKPRAQTEPLAVAAEVFSVLLLSLCLCPDITDWWLTLPQRNLRCHTCWPLLFHLEYREISGVAHSSVTEECKPSVLLVYTPSIPPSLYADSALRL